jgi:hypothetical protein
LYREKVPPLETDDTVLNLNTEINGTNNSVAVEEFACMHDKPFMHVMAEGYNEDASKQINKPWKKRYSL